MQDHGSQLCSLRTNDLTPEKEQLSELFTTILFCFLGQNHSLEVNNVEVHVPAFFKHIFFLQLVWHTQITYLTIV